MISPVADKWWIGWINCFLNTTNQTCSNISKYFNNAIYISVTIQPIPAATIFRIVLSLAWRQVSTMASRITNNFIFVQHVQANKKVAIKPLLTIFYFILFYFIFFFLGGGSSEMTSNGLFWCLKNLWCVSTTRMIIQFCNRVLIDKWPRPTTRLMGLPVIVRMLK